MVCSNAKSQLKNYIISANGDTLNALNAQDKRVGKWVIKVAALREEPGYEEEGTFNKDGQKEGIWRRFSELGDLMAIETYSKGEKAGLQQYFGYLGDLEHDENWMPYNPEDPYDTIPIYGTGSNEVVDYKIVKAEPYSVRDGEWHYYEPGSGKILRTEIWDRNRLTNAGNKKNSAPAVREKPAKIDKTPEMLEWERKNKGKRIIDGRSGF